MDKRPPCLEANCKVQHPVRPWVETRDRDAWMARPQPVEPPDSARDDMTAVGLAIAVLIVLVILSSWLPS